MYNHVDDTFLKFKILEMLHYFEVKENVWPNNAGTMVNFYRQLLYHNNNF